jgi:hypothetical protein
VTLGLAIASGTMMVAGALTYPLVGGDGIAIWAQRLVWADLEHTVLTPLGITDPWLAIAPVLAALAAAIIFTARATPRRRSAAAGILPARLGAADCPPSTGELSPARRRCRERRLVALAAGASAPAPPLASHLERRAMPYRRQALLNNNRQATGAADRIGESWRMAPPRRRRG